MHATDVPGSSADSQPTALPTRTATLTATHQFTLVLPLTGAGAVPPLGQGWLAKAGLIRDQQSVLGVLAPLVTACYKPLLDLAGRLRPPLPGTAGGF